MPKISVIVPIYGVEKYIEKCARSLFEQTLDDIEYIFVNDCTKDLSINVLQRVIEEYPSRKKNVTILHHKENKGLPSARKTGVAVATGEYIIYCDSDDWVDITAYEKAYEKAIAETADIVFFDYWKASDSHCIPYHKSVPFKDRHLLLSKMLLGYTDASNVWSALVRRNLYDNIEFPIYNQMEDKVLMFQFVFYATKMTGITECLYYYRENLQSISRIEGKMYDIDRWNNIKANYELLFRFLSVKSVDFQDVIYVSKHMLRVSNPQCKYKVYHEVTYGKLFLNKWYWIYNYYMIKRKFLKIKNKFYFPNIG